MNNNAQLGIVMITGGPKNNNAQLDGDKAARNKAILFLDKYRHHMDLVGDGDKAARRCVAGGGG
jgi:hypothetical protein